MATKTRAISFVWGFAEGTFFFLVPDIWLSRIVLKDKKEAYINIVFTVLGALLGGTALYILAMAHFDHMKLGLTYVPAVNGDMVEQVGVQIQGSGLWAALLAGIASGVPYKIYASWAGHLELSFAAFLGASICIRALRFTLVTGAAQLAAFLLRNVVSTPKLYLIHAASWIIFYVFYFTKFGFL